MLRLLVSEDIVPERDLVAGTGLVTKATIVVHDQGCPSWFVSWADPELLAHGD